MPTTRLSRGPSIVLIAMIVVDPELWLFAKLMSWLLCKTLDRQVFDLTGASMVQQSHSFSLQLETPQS